MANALATIEATCAVEKKFTDHVKQLLLTDDVFRLIDTVYEGKYIRGHDGVHRFQIVDEWPKVFRRRIENEEISIPLHDTRHCTIRAMKTQNKNAYIFRYNATAFGLAFSEMQKPSDGFVYTAVIKTNKRYHFVKRYNEKVTERLTACIDAEGYCLNNGKCVRNPITNTQHCECHKDFRGERCSVRTLSTTDDDHDEFDSHHVAMMWIVACCAFLATLAIGIFVSARWKLKALEKMNKNKSTCT